MIFRTPETVIRPNWRMVGALTTALIIFLLGLALGLKVAEKPDCQLCHVGFATVDEMETLIESLRHCKMGCSD